MTIGYVRQDSGASAAIGETNMNAPSRAACFSVRDHPGTKTPPPRRTTSAASLRNGVMRAALGVIIIAGSSANAAAQDVRPPPKPQTMPVPPPPPATSDEQARLEQVFIKAMTNIVLEGTWQMTGKDGKLTETRDDRYDIISVSKGFADHWVISARMQFGGNDMIVPFPVRVVWAGDTPIITIDDFAVPGMGTYSARVMIYRDYYCGLWFGKGYSGIMSGRIVPAGDVEEKDETPPADGKTTEDDKKPDHQSEPQSVPRP